MFTLYTMPMVTPKALSWHCSWPAMAHQAFVVVASGLWQTFTCSGPMFG